MGIDDLLLYGASGVVSSLTLAVMHWTPIVGSANERDRRICYALGTSVVVGVPVTAMILASVIGMERGQLYWAAYLLVNTFVSGLAVQLCYLVDDGQPVTVKDVKKYGDN